jgi:hypothetical protein
LKKDERACRSISLPDDVLVGSDRGHLHRKQFQCLSFGLGHIDDRSPFLDKQVLRRGG